MSGAMIGMHGTRHVRRNGGVFSPPSEAGATRGVNPLLLSSFSSLAGVEADDLERLARDTESHLVPTGKTLFSQGDGADGVYILLDGAVRLERRESDGHRECQEAMGLHASFGDLVLTGETSRHYTATTTAETLLLKIPLELLREVLGRHPEIATLWAYSVTGHMEFKRARLTESLRQRLETSTSAFVDAA